MTESWYAELFADPGHHLLGGVKRTESSRFATEQQAWDWLQQALKINGEAGRLATGWMKRSGKTPEIDKNGQIARRT